MKRWLALPVVFALGLGAIIYGHVERVTCPVSPAPILYFIADSEQELTRLPVNFTHLSDADEIRIGDQLAREYSSIWPNPKRESPDDRAVQRYVENVGERVAAHAYRKLPYKFYYIPDMDFINAFALPGGHVYIGAGLLSEMKTEDELAFVLGHEVEHIDHYDCVERVRTQIALRRVPFGPLLTVPVEVFEAGYSKNREFQADHDGARLAVAAGYSPRGAIQMLETFERLEHDRPLRAPTPQQELSQVAWRTLNGYFRSHPLPSERIAQIKRMIAEEDWTKPPAERTLTVQYIFLTRRATEAIATHDFQKASRLAAESLAMKPDQANALEVLAEAKFALKDYSAASAAYQQIAALSPQDAAQITNFAAAQAKAALEQNHFNEAAELAGETLKMRADQQGALKVLAEANFAQADFTLAAQAYRQLLGKSPYSASWVSSYATSLSAEGNSHEAAREFASWRKSAVSPNMTADVSARIEQAGLDLMDGHPAELDQFIAHARMAGLGSLDAGSIARLGWWCYRAGKYETASYLLTSVGPTGGYRDAARNTLGWVEIEQGLPDIAARNFTDPMGRAAAQWRAHKPEEALRNYSAAVDAKPEWLDPRWVKGLYSARVERSISEMQAERTRRDQLAVR